MHKHHVVHPVAGASADVAAELATEGHMQLVAEQQDVYWRLNFAKEPYYVAGRGYDQYRPAYALAWHAALKYPDVSYADLAPSLEAAWAVCYATSLLPWREVQSAAHRAWVRAQHDMQEIQRGCWQRVMYSSKVADALQSLRKSCLTLTADLVCEQAVPMNGFARQVMDRHALLLQGLAQGLESRLAADGHLRSLHDPRLSTWRLQWRKFSAYWSQERTVQQVFELLENRERALIVNYQASVRLPELPYAICTLLTQQWRTLHHHLENLIVARQNWALS